MRSLHRYKFLKHPAVIAALLFCLLSATSAYPADTPPELDTPFVAIPARHFIMGDARGDTNEAPRPASVQAFRLMSHEATNRQFAAFVRQSGYATDPERRGQGWVWTGRWREVPGADWRHPQGPGSSITGREDHPVVQVSARDAAAFCAYYGLRLPRETEWEFAARGSDGRRYPWGNTAPRQDDRLSAQRLANFGTVDCCAPDSRDGFAGTAPVGQFPAGASPFGALDMAGNVWEWTASPFPGQPAEVALRGGGWGNNPYCLRTAYRHGNPPDIGLDMVGIRCAGNLP